MKTIIKFRALSLQNDWQKSDPDWVYGDLARQWDHGAQGTCYIDYFIHTFTGYDRPIEVDGRSVCQFTGIKDKTGREIYQGDIVKGNHPDLMIIESINNGLQMFNIKYYGQDYNDLISESTCNPQTKSWLQNSEVIGNIFDNPDLINK